MPLTFRLAKDSEYDKLESFTIAAFEPITWFRIIDEKYGPLNGLDWRERWRRRFRKIWGTQIILVGEKDGEAAALATASIDHAARLGYIDLLAVAGPFQGKGYGREMLRAMLQHLKEQHGCLHAHLECLTTNTVGNALYKSEGFEEVARSIRWFIKIP
jgi:ribosomal protein S18 acetylase RimI-like enzyme